MTETDRDTDDRDDRDDGKKDIKMMALSTTST